MLTQTDMEAPSKTREIKYANLPLWPCPAPCSPSSLDIELLDGQQVSKMALSPGNIDPHTLKTSDLFNHKLWGGGLFSIAVQEERIKAPHPVCFRMSENQ